MTLLLWQERKRKNKGDDFFMKEQKFIYKEDNNYKEIFADDVISTAINGYARIIFIDTSVEFPTESERTKDGEVRLKQPNNENTFLKKYKSGIIFPVERIPDLIENLKLTYNNYKKDNESKKKE